MAETWSEERLLALTKNKAKESFELEFKGCGALKKTDGAKIEISKDVSAMANAAGGTIIYGIVEKDHGADSLDAGFDQNEVSKEWLEQVIYSNIHPRLESLRITPVTLPSKGGSVAYVVEIDQAVSRAPHQAADKRYYKRMNFQVVPMEDYEIRDVLRRARSPDLAMSCYLLPKSIKRLEKDGGDWMTFALDFQVFNNSTEPALYASFFARFDRGLQVTSAGNNFEHRGLNPAEFLGNEVKFLTYSRAWIVPNEFPILKEQPMNVGRFHLTFLISNLPKRFIMGLGLRAPGCAQDDYGWIDYDDGNLDLKKVPSQP
jgi:hypothetical protein